MWATLLRDIGASNSKALILVAISRVQRLVQGCKDLWPGSRQYSLEFGAGTHLLRSASLPLQEGTPAQHEDLACQACIVYGVE